MPNPNGYRTATRNKPRTSIRASLLREMLLDLQILQGKGMQTANGNLLRRTYETTWMTPMRWRITSVPTTAAASGKKSRTLLVIFSIIFFLLLIVQGRLLLEMKKPSSRLELYRLPWEKCQAESSSRHVLPGLVPVACAHRHRIPNNQRETRASPSSCHAASGEGSVMLFIRTRERENENEDES